MHNQLKIKYPNYPFIWDYNDMARTFSPSYNTIDQNEILTKIIDIFVTDEEQNNIQRNIYEDKDIIEFLTNLTHPDKTQMMYDKIQYVEMTQHIPRSEKNLWINFHTTTYYNDNDALLNKEYDTEVGWCLIPIIGSIYPFDIHQYTIDTQLQKHKYRHRDNEKDEAISNDVAKCLDPKIYKGNIDNKFDKFEANIRNTRVSTRNFIKRDDDDIIEKKTDVFTNNSDVPVNQCVYSKTNTRQLELNSNTRVSAQMIRDRLANPYKMNRCKNNPDLYKQHMRIDLNLRSVGKNIADNNNNEINKGKIIVEHDWFDYIYDKIIIHRVSNILRFSPATSGRLKFNHNNRDTELYFISVLHHKRNLQITLHHIELI
jgi:hypothetical protein